MPSATARLLSFSRGVMLLLIVVLVGCSRSAPSARNSENDGPSRPKVTTISPERKSLRRVVEQPGTIQPHEESQLYARVPGYLNKIRVDIGDRVQGPKFDAKGKEIEPGQVLAEIYVPELKEELNHKEALIRQVEADVVQAEKALVAAEAHVSTCEASVLESQAGQERWSSEAKRIGKMVQSGIIDAQTFEETQNQSKAASAKVMSCQAMVKKAKADSDKARADLRSAQARVDVARAEARRVDALVRYSKIRAPFDGVITRRKVHTGDFVQPAASKGDYLFTVSKLDPVRIVIDVPEADADLVKENTHVRLKIPSLHVLDLDVKITRTSWALVPGSRTLRAEIDLPNAEGKYRPGTYVYATMRGDRPESWVLPSSALTQQANVTTAFLIENDKAQRIQLMTGRRDAKFVEVLRYKKTADADWKEWTGNEKISASPSGLSDDLEVELAGAR